MKFVRTMRSATIGAAFTMALAPVLAQETPRSTANQNDQRSTGVAGANQDAQLSTGVAGANRDARLSTGVAGANQNAQLSTGVNGATNATVGHSLMLSEMLNWNIVLQNGTTVGQISNFVVGPQGNILYAIGTTENNQSFVVPFSALTINPNTQTAQLPLSSAQFGNVEFFQGSNLPNFGSRGFQMQMRQIFGTQVPSVPADRLMTLADLGNFNIALQNGTTVGQITDFVVSPQGTVLFGIGTNNGQSFVVPFGSMTFNGTTQTAQVPLNNNQFDNGVFFNANEVPNFDSQAVQQQLRQVFGNGATVTPGVPRGQGNLGANQTQGRDVLNPAGQAPPGLNRNQITRQNVTQDNQVDRENPDAVDDTGITNPTNQPAGAAVRGADRNRNNLNVPPTDRGANRIQGRDTLNPAGKAPPGLNRSGNLPPANRGANRTDGAVQNPMGKNPPGLNRTVPSELPRRPIIPPSVPNRPIIPARPTAPPTISPPSVPQTTPPSSVPPTTVPGAGTVPGGSTVPSVPSTGGALPNTGSTK